MEEILKEILKSIPWVFSGIGNLFLSKTWNPSKNISRSNQQLNLITQALEIEEEEESYSVSLGKRHKFLRESILNMNPRKMADFYGYRTVAELERYEKGEEEFPTKSLEKLKTIFFIEESFLEEGNYFIFRTFDLYSDEVRKLLEEGFRPYFLCCNHDHSRFETYPVFYKKEEGHSRIVRANSVSSFKSTHGGYQNIAQIIKEMLRQKMDHSYAFVLGVDRATRQKLDQCVFYSSSGYFGHGQDGECADIFYDHYQGLKKYFENN